VRGRTKESKGGDQSCGTLRFVWHVYVRWQAMPLVASGHNKICPVNGYVCNMRKYSPSTYTFEHTSQVLHAMCYTMKSGFEWAQKVHAIERLHRPDANDMEHFNTRGIRYTWPLWVPMKRCIT
jgi:hypothetical protein